MTLPAPFRWLEKETGPKILLEALKTHGVKEVPGPGNSGEIMLWAARCGLTHIYKHDSTAWCGLAVAYWATMAGYKPPNAPLWALNWRNWGSPVPIERPCLGDVLVFKRKLANGGTAGHVGLYVGESTKNGVPYLAVLGGNQSDQVNISFIPRSRLVAVRRSPWHVGQPANVRPVRLDGVGRISSSEA